MSNITPTPTTTLNIPLLSGKQTIYSNLSNKVASVASVALQTLAATALYILGGFLIDAGAAIYNKVKEDPTIITRKDLEYEKTEEPDFQTAEVISGLTTEEPDVQTEKPDVQTEEPDVQTSEDISGLTHAKKPTMKATRRSKKTPPTFNADKRNPIAQRERTEEPRDNTENSRLTNITKAGAIIGGGIALGLGGRKALAYLTYFALDKAGKKALVKGMKKGAEFSAKMLIKK